MTERYKRRWFPVANRSHQYRFLTMMLIYNIIIVGCLAIFLFVPDMLKLYDTNLSLEIRGVAADRILSIHSRIWPLIISLVCVIGIHSFLIFHRFVGPLYRITVAFGQIRKGDLSFRVRLREKDYLHEEEKAFNEMLEKLAEKIGGIKSAGVGAMESLDELENGINEMGGLKDINKGALIDLREQLDTLMENSDYFVLPSD
ncbi:MAG: methyl-accepting chemotaxis protein [Desulfobacterales bacterium]|nr:methyl-accepting chemotaxis protein [Desulfobacterales bacterium]